MSSFLFSGHFPLGAEFCAFWVTMDVLMCTASIWHMCTMSMDRYFTLKYPMQYGRNKTKKMVAIKIVFVWAISITISSPICIYGLVDQQNLYNNNNCVITFKEFVIYGSIFAFYVPLCIMILTYTLTIRILWQNQHMMRTIERSNFRMRPRSNGRNCNVMTYLSPPSSDSRRDSHTDISSLARTTNMEKPTLVSNCSDSETKMLELKSAIDNAYVARICSKNTGTDSSKCDIQNNNNESTENSNNGIQFQNKSNVAGSNRSLNYCSAGPVLNLPVTTVHIQSPSSDDDDEFSSLLHSSRDKLSRSLSQSSSCSQFRLRTNTDVTNKSYLSIHSSLKLPKHHEKNNLQSSVSCSNFAETGGKDGDLFDSLGLHGGNMLNRDYKSLEWCHHFYAIQAEMDQCLLESKCDPKHEMTALSHRDNDTTKSSHIAEFSTQNSTDTHDSGIASCSRKDDIFNHNEASIEISESGDSLDELESSSENAVELVSIKLHPKSVYMYKLDVTKDHNVDADTKQSHSANNNHVSRKNVSYTQEHENSSESESGKHRIYLGNSLDNTNKISRRKTGSLKQFFHKCKKKNGIRNLVSTKTTTNEKKASKVLGIIFAVFVILWTPFFIANILSVTCTSCGLYITPVMMSSFVWMGYIASLANPIIYTMFNTAFRRAFIKILSCKPCTHGRKTFHLPGYPSQMASVLTDRRQTLTVLTNGHFHDPLSNHSNGR